MSDCSSLSTVEGKLPAGFRFHPRDDELICDYLMKKILLISPLSVHHHHLNYSGVIDNTAAFALLIDVDLNKVEPWELPEIACVAGKEWYFYSQRDRKYATGLRTNRATVSGYWKATGKDRAVVRKGSLVGMRKTLVFYQGRAPKGKKTDWVMHEFRLEGPFGPPKSSSSKEDWVLCRVFHKSRDSLPPKPTNTNTYDETGCSSLPALMDSYISFDTNDDNDDDDDDDDNNNNENKSLGSYQQLVPCFSINNMSPTNPSHFSHLFHVAPTQPPTTKAHTGGGPMGGVYYTPAYGNNLQQFAGDDNVNVVMSSGGGSSSDRHMIKAVLSHLTNNMESSSSPSPAVNGGDEAGGGGSNSESYLSDVMWTSHY